MVLIEGSESGETVWMRTIVSLALVLFSSLQEDDLSLVDHTF